MASLLHFSARIMRRAGNELLKRASGKQIWIDVGAHHGETSLNPALSDPNLTVFAFEPNLRAASSMFARAANFVVLPMAVAEADGSAALRLNSLDEASSLLPMDEAARRSWIGGDALCEETVVYVPTIRLDTFMDLMSIAQVDFLKVDAQGNDLAVVRSAGRRLKDVRRITLEVDVTPRRLYQGSPNKEEVLSFLAVAGFKLVSTDQQTHGQEENLTFERSA